MRTNTKEVSSKVQEHILNQYEDINVLIADIKASNRTGTTTYSDIKEFVQNGAFAIYNFEMVEFLGTMDINPKGKEFEVSKSVELYVHLLAREITKMINKLS